MKTVMARAFWIPVVLIAAGCAPADTTTQVEAPPAPEPVREVLTREAQQAMTPEAVLADLKAGNERFVAGRLTLRDYPAQAAATAAGQYPKAVVLSCLDSRVPTEIIFDQGIGDIFVGRVAGNVEDVAMLGSMEFATAAAGSKLIVILGHSACGAVKGAADGVEMGKLTELLANIDPALERAQAATEPPYDSSNTAYVNAAIEENVRRTMADIVERSPVIAEQVEAGSIAVVGGIYDLATGRVTWLDS